MSEPRLVSAPPARGEPPVRAVTGHGWQWHTSRTGSWLRPFATAGITDAVSVALAPAASGPGQITVVVDPDDSAEIARVVGRACRRMGRFVVHTGPGQYAAARFQSEVLGALGKHWDRAAQGGNATAGQLVRAWLRAERARDLIVLRAHQVSGPALSWLLSLPVREYLRVWLISPQPLTTVADIADVKVTSVHPTRAWPDADLAAHDEAGCGCEDLNRLAPASVAGMSATIGLTVDIARRLRRLYDIEAAALAAAAGLLGCPDPDTLAAARIRVAGDARGVATAQGAVLAVPEYAQALLRGWAGQYLLPQEWAHDVAATYVTLRLEAAERHTGVRLIDPNLPQLLLSAEILTAGWRIYCQRLERHSARGYGVALSFPL